jgi:hypothetical protein
VEPEKWKGGPAGGRINVYGVLSRGKYYSGWQKKKRMVVAGIPDVIEYHNFVILGRRCE